ncbi:hypothetical protein BC939DRAFT_501928, partial [Gamsiella multidivaricata]|uniref:uncharacterized protein n=1 Tax=Gamsiella multidivaricata TaxID=101098 RepID=UPI002220433F
MSGSSGIRTRTSAAKSSSSSAMASSSASSSTTTAHSLLQGQQESKDTATAGVFSIRPSSATGSAAAAAAEANGDKSERDQDQDQTENLATISPRNYGTIKDSEEPSKTCHWDEVPAWMQDNPAIWNGYRRPTFSYKKCLASLGFLHNESVNIWTHLIGAVVCIVGSPLAYFKIHNILETIIWTDVAVFYIFMAGAVVCLSMSASFHTFSCHSEP